MSDNLLALAVLIVGLIVAIVVVVGGVDVIVGGQLQFSEYVQDLTVLGSAIGVAIGAVLYRNHKE